MPRIAILALLSAAPLSAQVIDGRQANPIVLMLIIGAIALAPFLAIMTTSFVKTSIVLGIVKNGFDSKVPSGQVTAGLALVLTFFIMAPVARDMWKAAGMEGENAGALLSENLTEIMKAADKGKEPLRRFLLRHAHAPDRELFRSLSQRLEPQQSGPQQSGPQPAAAQPSDEAFRVILPAFVTSELKSSFQIAFLILLPFLVIDLVIANVLVASGLGMIQPAVVSLPLKILLFVVADGWYLIVKGLVLGYAYR